MPNSEASLPPSDRTDAEGPRKKETFSQYLERIAVQDHGAKPANPDVDKPWRRWPKLSFEERCDRIMRGEDPDARNVGEEG